MFREYVNHHFNSVNQFDGSLTPEQIEYRAHVNRLAFRSMDLVEQARKSDMGDKEAIAGFLDTAREAAIEAAMLDPRSDVQGVEYHSRPVDEALLQTALANVDLLRDYGQAFELASMVVHGKEHQDVCSQLTRRVFRDDVPVEQILPYVELMGGVWDRLPLIERLIGISQTQPPDLVTQNIFRGLIKKAEEDFNRIFWPEDGHVYYGQMLERVKGAILIPS